MECGIEAYCQGLQEDKTNWVSRIAVAIKSDISTIEDSFYNIIDEIVVRKLSFKALMENSFASIGEDETYEMFKKEFIELIQSQDYSHLDEKLSAITQVINVDSYEGFILTRLQALLQNFSQSDKEYKNLLEIACELLEIDIKQDTKHSSESEKNQAQEQSASTQTEETQIDQEAIDSALAILKAQQKVLEHSKDDLVLDRTKRLLSSVLGFLGSEISDELDSINDKDSLEEFVKRTIDSLQTSSPKPQTEQQKPKEIKQETKKPQSKKSPLQQSTSQKLSR